MLSSESSEAIGESNERRNFETSTQGSAEAVDVSATSADLAGSLDAKAAA